MDFFEHQDVARRKTTLLVFYFILAVVLIIAAVYAVFALAFLYFGATEDPSRAGEQVTLVHFWDPGLFLIVAGGTILLVSGGSLFKIMALSGGGHTVAEMLGGRMVHPETNDPDERKLLNVVEEMSIAAGIPVLPVYVMDQEEGINAFAAGYSPSDAVVGVTRGCIRNLSRDELQGVIAHEFSHILNGDMRLNIRLMGILFGILLISIVGWILVRSSMVGRYRTYARSNRKGGNPLPLIGIALYVIGYVGVFFGKLIKSAVSRQREYLADASAVQFTRNPDGLAGALKKIGAYSRGSKVENAEAEEASHMFFGDAVGGAFLNVMATHPPLVQRIRRIDPSFDGDFAKVKLGPPPAQVEARRAAVRKPQPAQQQRFDPVEAITKIGTVDPQRLAYAAALLASIPQPVHRLAHEPYGARAIVYALLLDPENEEVRKAQLGQLAQGADPQVYYETRKILPQVQREVGPEARLPLVEVALPALRQLSPEQFQAFQVNVRKLMEADRKISLFEFALLRLLMRHLGPQFGQAKPPSIRHRTFASITQPTATLLSALARLGQSDRPGIERAFAAGVRALGGEDAPLALAPPDQSGLEAVDGALKELAAATPQLKKRVIEGCAVTIGADGQVTVEEGELLRAIADSLDCPMPPLLDTPSETTV